MVGAGVGATGDGASVCAGVGAGVGGVGAGGGVGAHKFISFLVVVPPSMHMFRFVDQPHGASQSLPHCLDSHVNGWDVGWVGTLAAHHLDSPKRPMPTWCAHCAPPSTVWQIRSSRFQPHVPVHCVEHGIAAQGSVHCCTFL